MQRYLNNINFVLQPRRKPLLAARVASSFLRHFVCSDLSKRPLRNMDISLNYSCNLTCDHCSCEEMKNEDTSLTAEQYKKMAREALRLGVIYFAFTGGEPLMNRNLEDIINLFSPSKCLIGLQTNAVLLDSARIESLYGAGLDVLQVSLDSSNPEIHDEFRKMKGAYQLTMQNVEKAILRGIKIIFCTTITSQNMRSKETLDLLVFSKDRNIPLVVSIPCPVGKWTKNDSVLWNDEDRQYFKDLQRRFPLLRRDFDSNYSKLGCSAATEKLYVTPYGDVIPCPFIHISFGNVKTEPLSVIRKRMLKLDRFNEYCNICLAGEDASFIERYIVPTYQEDRLPMKWENHPVLSKTCR
jgi:MoaA/NifB/PqqE/SkfB family radical SAM enzyme